MPSVCFECFRRIRPLYLSRLAFEKERRVPPAPNSFPLNWVWKIKSVTDREVLRMVGLDGYMLLRYILICFRIGFFFSFWGLVFLTPIYSYSDGGSVGWNKFTLANIPSNNMNAYELWTPVIFFYMFSVFFCQLMYYEYKNFIRKRLQYLIQGDSDTPTQTYYTVVYKYQF